MTAVVLVPATAADRARLTRVRAPRPLARYVHWNRFWLDRAAEDPSIRMFLVRAGKRQALVGCMALGPHEAVDLSPHARVPGIGETYHLVIGAGHVRRGHGAAAIRLAVDELTRLDPRLRAIRLAHHPDNAVAASFYERLGFAEIGRRADAETGISDILRELRPPRLSPR